jgi:hypothetical protein
LSAAVLSRDGCAAYRSHGLLGGAGRNLDRDESAAGPLDAVIWVRPASVLGPHFGVELDPLPRLLLFIIFNFLGREAGPGWAGVGGEGNALLSRGIAAQFEW